MSEDGILTTRDELTIVKNFAVVYDIYNCRNYILIDEIGAFGKNPHGTYYISMKGGKTFSIEKDQYDQICEYFVGKDVE